MGPSGCRALGAAAAQLAQWAPGLAHALCLAPRPPLPVPRVRTTARHPGATLAPPWRHPGWRTAFRHCASRASSGPDTHRAAAASTSAATSASTSAPSSARVSGAPRRLVTGPQPQDDVAPPGGDVEDLVEVEYSIPPRSMSTREAARRTGGGRGLLAFFADHQPVPLPPNHRFPMNKYRRMRSSLLLDESLADVLHIHPAPFISHEELLRVHCPEYLEKVETGTLTDLEVRAIGFPWSLFSVNRAKASCGGTVAATHAVLQGLWAAASNMAGGTHHAFRDRGEGFCIYNDIAVASLVALQEYPEQCNAQRPILVLDLDVHQGNGTAALFEGSDTVLTFSAHGANNYPWRSKMRSLYDVELDDGVQDEEYLAMLHNWLPLLFQRHNPGLVIFQAGVDALKEDSFGRLSLTHNGLLKRNHMVYSQCIQSRVPLVITMGGGYSRPPDASIRAHADVYRSAAYRFSAIPFQSKGTMSL